MSDVAEAIELPNVLHVCFVALKFLDIFFS